VILPVAVVAAILAFGQIVQQDGERYLPDAIMARVATNQDRSEVLRKQYICREHIHIVTGKTDGKLMREETADYEIAPSTLGSQIELKGLTGRYSHNGKYVDFAGEPIPDANSWDADYIRDVRKCLTEDSRCTVGAHLFPFTTAEQNKYDFRVLGQEVVRERKVYHVEFVPKNKKAFDWVGEVYIDVIDFQPLRVVTRLSRRVPIFIRSLGTNISGVGYELDYQRQEDGSWLPNSYGSEYEIHLFFRTNRTVAVSMDVSFEPGNLHAQ
jgi:hypothetical protein